jgi:hypothetical protein
VFDNEFNQQKAAKNLKTYTLAFNPTQDFEKQLEQHRSKKCYILAIIGFIYITTFRPTTIEYMVISDLTFKFKQI